VALEAVIGVVEVLGGGSAFEGESVVVGRIPLHAQAPIMVRDCSRPVGGTSADWCSN